MRCATKLVDACLRHDYLLACGDGGSFGRRCFIVVYIKEEVRGSQKGVERIFGMKNGVFGFFETNEVVVSSVADRESVESSERRR